MCVELSRGFELKQQEYKIVESSFLPSHVNCPISLLYCEEKKKRITIAFCEITIVFLYFVFLSPAKLLIGIKNLLKIFLMTALYY